MIGYGWSGSWRIAPRARLGQKAGAGLAASADALVDRRQQQAGQGDVDLFRRAEIPLHRHFDHRPNPAGEVGIGSMFGERARRRHVPAVLDQGLAVEIDGVLGLVDGFVQGCLLYTSRCV